MKNNKSNNKHYHKQFRMYIFNNNIITSTIQALLSWRKENIWPWNERKQKNEETFFGEGKTEKNIGGGWAIGWA